MPSTTSLHGPVDAHQRRAVRGAAGITALFLLAGTAQAQREPPVDSVALGPIIVDAESDDLLVQDGYVGLRDRTGSKTDTPLVRVPQSTSAVTERQLDEQNPRTLQEALEHTPGIRIGAFGFDPRFDAFFIRGFEATYSGVFRDGLRQYNSPTGLFRHEPYGLEGATILKGPASALYGASNAGGLVNLMTKRPTETAFRETELQVGSHDRVQGNLDLSGPVDAAGTLRYRLTGLVRSSGSGLPDFADDRVFLAPAFTWSPSPATSLTVLTEYMDSTVGGTASYHNDASGVTDLYAGIEGYNDFPQQQARIGYEAEHRIGGGPVLRQNLRYSWLDMDLEYGFWMPDENATGALNQLAGRAAEDVESVVLDNQAVTDFSIGNADHRLLLGVDYGWIDYAQDQNTGAPIPPPGETLPLSFTESQQIRQLGLYVSDEIERDALQLTLGLRQDHVEGETETPETDTRTDDDELSWRIGLSYDLPSGIVPFANYSTSFTPNVGTLISGEPANPTTGEQIEVGAKYLFDDDRLSLSLAVFDISQDDAVVFEVIDERNEQVNRSLRSRGFELESRASLQAGIDLIAAYTYLDVEITDSPGGLAGNALNATPAHVLSLWADHDVQRGPAVGFGGALGIRYSGESFGDDANTIENDGVTRLDAALHYDAGRRYPELQGLTLQLNARNLLDEREQTCAAGFCYRDEGRHVIGSLRYRF